MQFATLGVTAGDAESRNVTFLWPHQRNGDLARLYKLPVSVNSLRLLPGHAAGAFCARPSVVYIKSRLKTT